MIFFIVYEKFATDTNRKIPDNLYMDKATHPVIFVSWDDAYYYTKWLAEQTGEDYRLLSEAECYKLLYNNLIASDKQENEEPTV